MRHGLAALALGLLLAAPSVSAATFQWSTHLSGDQEVPPRVTTATGFGTVTFNNTTNILDLYLEWSGLTTETTQAHIHCCVAPTGNVGIALDLWLPADPDSPRPTSGVYTASYDLSTQNPFRASFLLPSEDGLSAFMRLAEAMDNMEAYYNIHTVTYPGGEIRGNLQPIPEPGAFALFAAGGLMLFAARRMARSNRA